MPEVCEPVDSVTLTWSKVGRHKNATVAWTRAAGATEASEFFIGLQVKMQKVWRTLFDAKCGPNVREYTFDGLSWAKNRNGRAVVAVTCINCVQSEPVYSAEVPAP